VSVDTPFRSNPPESEFFLSALLKEACSELFIFRSWIQDGILPALNFFPAL